tara:strand:- start:298 stop:504 length:207 start_codon:yes stop_codon:yes gene_type:complete
VARAPDAELVADVDLVAALHAEVEAGEPHPDVVVHVTDPLRVVDELVVGRRALLLTLKGTGHCGGLVR